MKFDDPLKAEGVTPKEIIAKLGCPTGTAYDWMDRRHPPRWQWPKWWAEILGAERAARYIDTFRRDSATPDKSQSKARPAKAGRARRK